MEPSDKDPELAQLLAPLVAQAQSHNAPAELRARILRSANDLGGQLALAGDATAARYPALDRAFAWLAERWWRGATAAATAAVIPLFAGVLLGYQPATTDSALLDPASEWLTSYQTQTDVLSAFETEGEAL